MEKTENMRNPIGILLVGNNPLEMGGMLDTIRGLEYKEIKSEFAFDQESIEGRLNDFRPDFILLDDNLGKGSLTSILSFLSHHKNTKDVPITILKNSNYEESSSAFGIFDFILKQNLSVESLYHTILNSIKFRKTRNYLSNLYQNRKAKVSLLP